MDKSWKNNNLLKESGNRTIKRRFSQQYDLNLNSGDTWHHLILNKEDPDRGNIENGVLIQGGKDSECIHRILHLMQKYEFKSFDELITALNKIPLYKVENGTLKVYHLKDIHF